MKIVLIIVSVAVLAWILWSFYAYTVETLAYEVIEKKSDYEIRRYQPYIAMQVETEGDTQAALYAGFRVLAGYIFGDNKGNAKVAMTAPVMESDSTEKVTVAMTAPVMEEARGGKHVITFTAPRTYTIETLPQPNNPSIRFVQVPAKKYAVHRFTWYYTTERIAAQKQVLLDALRRDGVTVLGAPLFAGYNGPGTAPFLMRNEILVEIE